MITPLKKEEYKEFPVNLNFKLMKNMSIECNDGIGKVKAITNNWIILEENDGNEIALNKDNWFRIIIDKEDIEFWKVILIHIKKLKIF